MDAKRPVMIPGYAGRGPKAFGLLVELAELAGAGVIDAHHRLNFPNRHPLNVAGTRRHRGGRLVLFLDVKDMERPTKTTDYTTRKITSRLAPGAKVLDLGYNDMAMSSWSQDFASLEEIDLQVTADTAVALPLLVEMCRGLVAQDAPQRAATERSQWRTRLADLHDEAWRAGGREQAEGCERHAGVDGDAGRARSGRSSRTTIGCWRPALRANGRTAYGISTCPTGTSGRRWDRRPRSRSRRVSRWRTVTPAGLSSTCSPMAT